MLLDCASPHVAACCLASCVLSESQVSLPDLKGVEIVSGLLRRSHRSTTRWLPLEDKLGLQLKVGIKVERLATGTLGVTLFVPYWVIDKTWSGLLFRHNRPQQLMQRLRESMWRARNVVVMPREDAAVAGQAALDPDAAGLFAYRTLNDDDGHNRARVRCREPRRASHRTWAPANFRRRHL